MGFLNILALNAGSATLKYKLFRMAEDGTSSELVLTEGSADHADGIVQAAEKVIEDCKADGVDVVAHRLVHGGPHFIRPTRVTPEVMGGLRGLRGLDPLHNPNEVAMIEAGLRLLPNAPAVAVFDTAFHHTLPETAWRYAILSDLADRYNLRRYGFHGLSHQYVSGELLKCLHRRPEGTKLIVCHLGSGASVCAVKDGRSIDTSMGLTPLEGLVMGTRSGDIDPGLLLYLLRVAKKTPDEIDDLLNHKSGLLGLSGTSNDVRELEKSAVSGDSKAELALDIFAYRVAKYIGSYAAALEGLDAIAFTGGIGEHSSGIRGRICKRLGFLGLHLDEAKNTQTANQAICVTTEQSTIQAWVVPTDEELQMARNTFALFDV